MKAATATALITSESRPFSAFRRCRSSRRKIARIASIITPRPAPK
jgi:hypothetical protein